MNPFNKMNGIQYLERCDIDNNKWDACISNADNGNIYGYVQYLDAMAMNWAALIIDDYSAVFPIPWKKKMGIAYIYTPRFMSPLAIYGRIPERLELKEIFDHIPEKFKLWDLNLANDLSVISGAAVRRKNHVLHLLEPHEKLRKNYRDSYRSLLKKAVGQTRKEVSIKEMVDLASGKKRIEGTNKDDYLRFQKLFILLNKKGKAFCYGQYSQTNTLLASAVFFISSGRIYYMLAWNSDEGRHVGASHQLIDSIIMEYSGKDYYLDFEGSDIPGIAFFFEGFGARSEEYYYLRENRLPWWCAWIKK